MALGIICRRGVTIVAPLLLFMTDLFPVEDFDGWAEDYDQSITNTPNFPFTGYEKILNTVVELADPQPGMRVLDLGTGTGNLALRFEALGCEIWGDEWEEEYYWLADESTAAFAEIGLRVEYIQVSSCAGIFTLQN